MDMPSSGGSPLLNWISYSMRFVLASPLSEHSILLRHYKIQHTRQSGNAVCSDAWHDSRIGGKSVRRSPLLPEIVLSCQICKGKANVSLCPNREFTVAQ